MPYTGNALSGPVFQQEVLYLKSAEQYEKIKHGELRSYIPPRSCLKQILTSKYNLQAKDFSLITLKCCPTTLLDAITIQLNPLFNSVIRPYFQAFCIFIAQFFVNSHPLSS